jgi:MFS transporter, DHA1 family, inner membrane transport protein
MTESLTKHKGRSGGPGQSVAGALAPTFVLALGTFAVGTDAFIIAGFLPSVAHSLHVSTGTAGQSVSVFAAAYAVLSPIVATLTARMPRRELLVAALIVLGLANLGSALAQNFPVLIATRVLAALGASAYTPNAGAVGSDLVRPELRARALAIVVGGLTIATALGVPLGSFAGRALGWRTALGIVAAVCLAVAAGVGLVMPKLPGGPRVPLRTRLGVLRRPVVLAVLPLTVLGMGASYTVYAYSVPAVEALGISGSNTTWMLTVYGVGAVVGNFWSGYATDRWGPVRVLLLAYALMAVSLGLLGAQSGGGWDAPLLAGVMVFLWGKSTWSQSPAQQHRLITAAPQEAPLVVSLNASAIYVGIGLGTVLGGAVLSASVTWIYTAAAVLAVLAFVFLLATLGAGARSGVRSEEQAEQTTR